MLTITHSQFVKRVKRRHAGKVNVLSKFTGILENVTAHCLECDTKFVQKADSLARYKTQCSCEHKKSQPKRLTPETFKTRVENRLNVTVLGRYSEFRSPVKVRSNVCGHAFKVTANSALWGKLSKVEVCPKCREVELHYPLNWFLSQLKETKSHLRLLTPELYSGVTSLCTFRCLRCQIDFDTTPRQTLHTKHCCPSCVQANIGYKRKPFVLGNKTFSLQGYEHLALRLLAKKVDLSSVKVGREVPRIRYFYEKDRIYYPDFYVPSVQALVEVKSTYTMLGKKEWLDVIKVKRKAVLSAGYKFSLVVFDKTENRVPLPDSWHQMTFKSLRRVMLGRS